jgi:hypothetical protein
MTNDFKMIVFKQLTISLKTQHDNKINVSCNANQQNVTHVKHDHQYRRNFKSLNIIWCIVCFFHAHVAVELSVLAIKNVVGTKPMLPAGSYVTSLGGLYVAMHDVKMV